jgi:iron(III) transport system permease protein
MGTAAICLILGLGLAWLLAAYSFPLSNFFEWTLILPLAIPSYIAGYTYAGILSYTGPIQTQLRSLGINLAPGVLDIMNLKGVIFIFSITLFPYVFIIVKGFLTKQSASLIEASKSLGKSDIVTFFKVVFPVSRGAIVGGVSLVILEVLNDYGLVAYFGIPTFSTGIFRTWLSLGDLDSAIKLSSILMFVIFLVLLLEKISSKRKSFSFSSTKIKPLKKTKLPGVRGYLATLICLFIFLVSFFIPFLQLLNWTFITYKKVLDFEFMGLVINSFTIAALTSLIIITLATIIANTARIRKNGLTRFCSKLANTGYSIPGAVISVGVLIFFMFLDKKVFRGLYGFLNLNKSLVLTGSILLLIFAYLVRFISIAYNSIEAGFDKVGKSFFEASKSLGMNTTQTFFKVDLKMIRPSIFGAFTLIFVDILKELPLTLILRPFNFHTLATKAFEYADDEMVHEASIASIIIIIVGSLAIFFFNRLGKKEEV